MPEWPDLHVLAEAFNERLSGGIITGAEAFNPIVLRIPVEGGFEELLKGKIFGNVDHRGKYLLFHLDGNSIRTGQPSGEQTGRQASEQSGGRPGEQLVVNPMLAGTFQYCPSGEKKPPKTCLAIHLDNGHDLRYIDEKQMGKVYYLPEPGYFSIIPEFGKLGSEADLSSVSMAEFVKKVRARHSDIRNLLMEQEFLAGIGNAYADEILFRAGIHPKRAAHSLSSEEAERIYRTIKELFAEAQAEIRAHLAKDLKGKVRHFFKVRGREGELCPVCGAKIVRRTHGLNEMCFCPKCQPAPAGHLY
ncbi:MAG: Fpg/Nei family DNA glycosylase [Syntrophothermus sp.]